MRPASLMPLFGGTHRQLVAFDAEPRERFAPGALDVGAGDLVKWIEAKNPRAITNWNDLGTDEYARAFTAARTAGFDIVDDLYFAFVDVMERGGTERDYAKLVVPTLQEKGWLRGDGEAIARRVQLIYDTNLRLARGAGQWDRIQKGKRSLPYLRAATARDTRVRRPPDSPHSDHRAWDGIILPVDHPFWTRWWVPLGFRCRCTIIPMTRSQLARYPGGVTSEADLAEREARLGTPIFAAPGAGVTAQLQQVAERVNNPPPRPESRGWTVGGVSGLTATEVNQFLQSGRMPGRPDLNIAAERSEALAAWTAETAAVLIDTLIDRLFG